MSDAPITLRVRGEGGDEFDMDLPAAGTLRRETFDYQVAKGWLTILEGEIPEDPADDDEPVTVDRPDDNAKKAEWVAYAVSKGRDEADMRKLTRDAIRDSLPAVDDEDTEPEDPEVAALAGDD